MGMVKSAARVALRGDTELGALLTLLNGVIFDLKSPAMYATFAGLQWRDGALSFAVAAHAPILRYRHGSPAVEELTMTQLPIAMFEDTEFAATPSRHAAGRPVRDPDRRPDRGVRRRRTGVRPRPDEGDVAAQADGPLDVLERSLLDAGAAHGHSSTISRCCWCGSL